MLGIAYTYGYGKEPNIEKAQNYFVKAMVKGHSWVEDIIEKNIVDSVSVARSLWKKSTIDVLDTVNLIQNNIDVNYFNRDYWKGFLYTYDWSGKMQIKQ